MMVIIHHLVDMDCFQGSLNEVVRSLERALMNAKLSSLPPLPSGKLKMPYVSKKTHNTQLSCTSPMISVSVPHCPLCSLPCGSKPSAYGVVPVVFPVRKALFACAYGSG